MLGERSGYDGHHLVDLARIYENWDGSGFPNGVSGEDIPVPVQVVQVAALAVNAERLMGADGALALVRGRSGRTLSPTASRPFLQSPNRSSPPLARPVHSGTP